MKDKEKIRAEIERRMKGRCPIVCSYIIYEDILNFIDSMQEEPVSEDLDSFAIKYAQDKPYPVTVCQAVKVGANWQKQQMESNRIEHCNSITNEQAELEQKFVSSHIEKNNRIPTYLDAIEYGMKYAEQQKRMAAW